MKITKKALSVLLAVVMIMSSMSVCFGTFSFAANNDNGDIKRFADQILATDALKTFSAGKSTGNTTGSGSTSGSTVTYSINLGSYSDYAKMVKLLECLDAAIKDLNAYQLKGAHSSDCGGGCLTPGDLKSEMESALKGNGLTAAQYAEYRVDAFLSCILHDEGVTYHAGNPTETQNNVPNRLWNTITISTTDYRGYLAQVGNRSNVASPIVLGYKYSIGMVRSNYVTKDDNGCDVNNYHSAINTSTEALKAPAASSNDGSAAKQVLNTYDAYLNTVDWDLDYEEMLAMVQDGSMDTFLDTFKAQRQTVINYVDYESNINTHPTFNALYSDKLTAINNMISSCEAALESDTYIAIADQWGEWVATHPNYGVFDYGAFDYDQMVIDYAEFTEIYNGVMAGGEELAKYLEKYGKIDREYYVNFTDNIKVYALQDYADNANAIYEEYKDSYADLDADAQTVIYSEFKGNLDAIPGFSTQVKNEIFPDGYQYLADFEVALRCELNETVRWFAEMAYGAYEDLSTSAVEDLIYETKGKLADFEGFYNGIVNEAGAANAEALMGQLLADSRAMLQNLYVLLANRFTAQVDYADELFTSLGRPSKVDFKTYFKLSAAFSGIDVSIYDVFLAAEGKQSLVSQATIDKYNALKAECYDKYIEYSKTYGFSDYAPYEYDYESRGEYDNDLIKVPVYDYDDEGNVTDVSTYDVTDEGLENLIAALDKIITSDTIKGLIGDENFNIGTMISDLLEGFLFTDDFINTIVEFLYPLVLTEFLKVWVDLPEEETAMGMTVRPSYDKDLHQVLTEAGFELFPDLLADALPAKYADNKALLKKAGVDVIAYKEKDAQGNDKLDANGDKIKVVEYTPWDATVLRDPETGKYAFTWGVDEAKAQYEAGDMTKEEFHDFFYQAFDDAVEGLKPLLYALIANQSWGSGTINDFASATVLVVVGVSIRLELKATPNRGYANLIVPIYEALGITDFTAPSVVEGYGTNTNGAAEILEAILTPLFGFIETLGRNPVETLTGVLPNLIYALSFNMIVPLLDMLKTSITYEAIAAACGMDAATIPGGADVSVGSMLNFDDLGIDFSGGINSLLKGFGLELPEIDQGILATLGELEIFNSQRADAIFKNFHTFAGYEKDDEGNDILDKPLYNYSGEAYSIKANKAAVGYYLLTYIFNLVKNEAALTSLLGMFITDEASLANIKGIVYDTLNLDELDVGDGIAAIVELANQVEYPVDGYYWLDSDDAEIGTPADETPAHEIYLNPNNDWTEEKADYLYNNLEALLNSIFTMAKLDINVESELSNLIGGFLTNETVTALAKMLGGLDINALLAGDDAEAAPAIDVNKILKDELGIDLGAFAQYKDIEEGEVIDFGVTDAASFVDALVELLAPFSPVLDFLFAGEDLSLINSAITLKGYNGYDNALVPLLEALGCDVKALAEGDNALELVLNALVAKIEAITTNTEENAKDGAIYSIIDMLPGVLYYLASNGLSQGVAKLLQPVYVLLDTIRPIYDLNLNDLLANIKINDEPLGLDLNNLSLEFVLGLVNDLAGLNLAGLDTVIYDICKEIGVEYESASSLESEWKKGAYNANFDQADLLTVVLSFVLEWIAVKENGEALDALLKTDGIVAAIGTVFASVEIAYGTPNWMYWFDSEEEFNNYIANGSAALPNTLAALEYPNDWTETAAAYLAENLSDLVDTVVAMVTEDENATVSSLLTGLVDEKLGGYFTTEMIDEIVGLLADFLKDIDDNLLEAAGYLLDVNIVGLKSYKAPAGINTLDAFVAELAKVLTTYAGGLVNWLFFGDDYRFAKKTDGNDSIVINGGLGYEKGLALVLEALGCELPAEVTVANVLGSLVDRINAILADPIDEIIALLPNLVYFLNADGASVAVNNLLAPVYALLDKLAAFGLEVNLADLLGFDLKYLSLEDILVLVETKTGLDLNLEAAKEILVDFCVGKIEKGTYTYKMVAEAKDVITILLTVALNLIANDENAAVLDELLGTEIISALKTVFASVVISYETPDWEYPLGENGTVDAMKYSITYPNNWTEATAEYLVNELPAIGDMIAGLIDSNYSTLGELLNDKVNVFTSDNLKSIVDLITNLLKDIDDSLVEAVGVLLNVDLAGLKAHEIPADIDTVEEFAAELSTILSTYAPGVIEWLLLGENYEFFVNDANKNGKYDEGEDFITIDGADGYEKGLALLLEALGCENLPTADGETADIVAGVLGSLAARIQAILDNPVEEIVNLLPNLLYFLNTNGVAAVVKNTTAALTALSTKLETFVDISLDVTEMVDLKELLKLPEEAKLSMNDLSMAAVLEAVGMLVGLDLSKVEDVLVNFALGEVVAYDSVSGEEAYKMVYADEFDKHDMLTVVANIALITLADDANAEFVKELAGEEIYNVILKVLNLEEAIAEVKKMSWASTEVGKDFSAIETSELYKEFVYGPNYTEEMAQYIADNFGAFVNNIIYLLGIQIGGENVNNLTDLLNGLVNGNLYNSSNVVAIRDALAGVLAGIGDLEVSGVNAGKYIKEVLKASLGMDLDAIAQVEVPEFTEDRAKFVEYLCDVLEPLYPVLRWLLADEDLAFFVDLDKANFITLPGAEGYKNGIVLLLEALGCENLVDPANLEGNDDLITSILNPLLDRVDEILANPAEELLAVLPNLIFFINSNGIDVVVKNTLNAVYTVLNAIEPIAKIDLYELIGLDLSTLTFEKLIEMVLENLEVAGFKFTGISIDTFAELTVGTLETYDSLSAEDPAYRMVYEAEGAEADMSTVVLRLLVTFITTDNNREVLVDLLKDALGMSEDAEKYVSGLFKLLADIVNNTQLGMDSALAALYYIYYGVDLGVGELVDSKKELDRLWKEKLEELNKNSTSEDTQVGDLITDIFDIIFNDPGEIPGDGGNDVLDQDGLASNGFIAFFQRIIKFFQEIGDFFRELFSFFG